MTPFERLETHMTDASAANSHGRFRWYELQTTDAAGAEAFYSAVVGWKAEHMGPQPGAYTIFNTDKGGIAGMMTLGAGEGSARWLGYVVVDDVDAAAENIKAAGGKVRQPPTDVPGMLRFCGVSDPQGAAFVVFRGESSDGPPTGARGEAGYVGWRELMADDAASAMAFYGEQFGWRPTQGFDMGPAGTYQLWTDGGDGDAGGMMTRSHVAGGLTGPTWRYYIQVNGADAAVARINAAGGKVVTGPQQVPSGDWVLEAVDPQGVTFHLTSTSR